MITDRQYLEYKALIEEYEAFTRLDDNGDDDWRVDSDDEHDPLEEEYTHCQCGAYTVSKKTGNIIKVSDCYC